jgi:MarR family transcriptional regulator, organic hydroperoxide resistance regulator
MGRLRRGGVLIAQIHQTAGRIFSKKLRAQGIDLNPAQGRILFALWQEDRIPIRELAARTSLRKSTLTGMLDRLERAGHLRRVPSPNDRRLILIQRTANDRACEAKYLQVSREMTALFYRGFSDQEIDRFEDDLARILDHLVATEARPVSPPS